MASATIRASWRQWLDASPHPVLVVNERAEALHANGAAGLEFGLPHGRLAAADTRLGAILRCLEAEGPGGCGLQPACADCGLRRAIGSALGGRPVRRETASVRLRRPEAGAREVSLLVSALAIGDEAPRVVYLTLEARAPTGEEARLRRELAAARALIDVVPVPVFVKGSDRAYVVVNRAAATLMGREAAALLGRSDADFFPPAVAAAHYAEDDRVLRTTEPLEVDEVIEGLARGRRSILVRKTASVGAHGEPLLVATVTDVTEIRSARDALLASRQEVDRGLSTLRGVVEATDASIFSVDRRYRYTVFNRAHAGVMRRIYGVEPELGRPLSELMQVPEDWLQARSNLDRAFGGEAFMAEAFSGGAGGERRFFEVSHAPVRSADGAVVGAAVISRDVTDRRLATEALRESEEKLRQAQKLEAIGLLAGGVAHDFNNLLSVILTSASLALEEPSVEDPLRESLQEIREAGDRAARLTRQLLAFSRRQVLKPKLLDLNALVRETERLLARVLGEDIQVRMRLADGLHLVLADPGQLEQVVLNLAVNARDAMPRGGRLLIETSEVELHAAFVERHAGARAGPHVRLALTDTGCGMDAATLARVFEPFFTTKAKGKGTGLGLATVYGIVKQSGGSIWVSSEPGRGTSFEIDLPRAAGRTPGEAPAPEEASLRSRPGESVLVVEDDEGVRRSAVRILEQLGYTVASAAGLGEVARLVADGQRTFTALLSDVVMPDGSGMEVWRHLRERIPGLRTVFMSGYTDEAIDRHGTLAPGTLFLEKPFSASTMGQRLREAIDA